MILPRVLSYPPRHPYVDRLHGTVAELVQREVAMPRIGPFYDPGWVHDQAADVDLAHLHFGHEQYGVDHVLAVIAAHHAVGVPVVMTVHDLQIPHLGPRDSHATDLVRAAAPLVDALLTLTPGCAAAVRRLTGRPVSVIPHGALTTASRRRRLRSDGVGRPDRSHPWLLLAGRLRPNLGWQEVVDAYRVVRPLRPLRVQVHPTREDEVRQATHDVRGITVVSQEHLSHCELESAIADAAAVVLPYRWGTHSGLLELAADLATPAVATDAGFLSQQHATVQIRVGEGDRINTDDLMVLFDNDSVLKHPGLICGDTERGRAQDAFLTRHRRVYRDLAGSARRR